MAKIFEDELMELQADYVSLCLEAMEGIADEIFIYISNEKDVSMFDSFCRVKGQVKTLGQLCPIPLQRELLMVGSGDIKKINEICKRYDMPAPTEIRLHYWVKSNSLDAHFEYKPVWQRAFRFTFRLWYGEGTSKPFNFAIPFNYSQIHTPQGLHPTVPPDFGTAEIHN